MEYYAAIKNEILTTCNNMDGLWGIMLLNISQTEKILYDFAYMLNLKNETNKSETNS